MCGIVGVVGAAGGVSRNRFLEMRDTIAHRGPDDAGFWQSPGGNVMLGSRRLAILDLSPNGHQPMADESSGMVIAFNGEIYNYVEIADQLASSGCRFRSRTDTEVLLKSYVTWGERCLERLNGMFAFAIWDERRQELFAARDRFGEKPLYWYQSPDRDLLAFASEIKALVASRLFSPRPNRAAVCSFLDNDGLDAGCETMLEGVLALPAAHALRFSLRDRSLNIWRYWNLDAENTIRFPDERQYADRFIELLSDSVRLRLRSDVPVGSSLSGGLDSSTIVGLVAKTGARARQETFSARFSDAAFDEGPHIRRMAAWAGVRNHTVYPDPKDLPEEIENLTWHQDAPFQSSSIYAQWCVMRLARDHGVTVLLDGQGGDEILAGYHSCFAGYFAGFLRRFRFLGAATAMRRYTGAHGSAHLPLILVGLLPPGLRLSAKAWRRPRALEKDFERASRRAVSAKGKKFGDPFHELLYDILTRTSLPSLLRYADRNSMAFSREVRLPFLDHRLVEYLFAIPVEQKLDGATTKVVLRNATRGIIPEETRDRKDKLGFAPPEHLWLRGPLREWADDILSSTQFKQREWIDTSAFDRVRARFAKGESALHTIIWRWLSLETWARACLACRLRTASDSLPAIATTASTSSLRIPAHTIAKARFKNDA
ncbi:MAG TPA: asparagine synthase (glutamine-hydrolyzing) [Candidatus Acidoferrales bacterium]|jgi:asparagine synthase (glutamine-hydrolysing)|nr:asparagine synthase (glutamine-hydrolyzing) [Candidatus Acidoferrales bacterium]